MIDKKSRDELKAAYNELVKTKTQKELGNEMGDIFAEVLGLEQIVGRGFVALSTLEWQKRNKMTTAEAEVLLPATKESRIKQTKEIFEILRKRVDRIVKVQNKEDKLELAIQKALKVYIEKYADRPQDSDAPTNS